MKKTATAFLILLILALMPLSAKAGCPIRADKLEDFARCMAPMKGMVGTTAVYSSGGYDQDHRELMTAMATQAVTAPHPMPIAPISYPALGFLSPYGGYLPINFTGHAYKYNPYNLAFMFAPFYSRPSTYIYAY